MALDYIIPEFEVVRNDARCTRCRICESQCANGVHTYNADGKVMVSDESKCVNCQRCVSFCPTHAGGGGTGACAGGHGQNHEQGQDNGYELLHFEINLSFCIFAFWNKK